jgi:uncharacterized surface protein with fasciclin (FAS1) repeats
MRTIKTICLLFLVNFVFTGCVKEEVEEELAPVVPTAPVTSNLKSIYDVVAANDKLTFLKAAVDRVPEVKTVLSGAGTFTLFAPTDDAFKASGLLTIDDVKNAFVEALRIRLQNQVVGSILKSSDLKNGYIKSLLQIPNSVDKRTLSIFVDVSSSGAITLNGKAKVGLSNIDASNGIIHIVDNEIPILSILGATKANPNLQTFVSYIENQYQKSIFDLLDAATPEKSLTLLAPTNKAFEGVFTDGGWGSVGVPRDLTTILQYHIVNGNNTSAFLFQGQTITTNGSQTLTVLKDASSIKFQDTKGNTGKVVPNIGADIQCVNGVVHAIDAVLQPNLTK